MLLLIGSYVFYGWWDWRFLGLILISSIVDFLIGYKIHNSNKEHIRKYLLFLSLSVNLGILGFFKYFNFFIDSFSALLLQLGVQSNPYSLNIILPVGISFYTFQTMSYTIDIYKRQLNATHNFVEFLTFVSFFPQLVAGPIERASNLLPQFQLKRKFNYYEAKEGIKQLFWGLFKKIVIADNCAHFVNTIFENQEQLSGSILVAGAVFFAFQIYGDFSGYSDMAIGISRIMGFSLMQNFSRPYLATNIQEFWRRWHISLSTWFRDYVYLPLGGSRVNNNFKKNTNIFITFTISGLWHGANWTFVVWGMLHSLFHIVYTYFSKWTKSIQLPFLTPLSTLITFSMVVIGWVFFRANSLFDALNYLSNMFSNTLFKSPLKSIDYLGLNKSQFLFTCLFILFLLLLEFFSKNAKYDFELKKLNAFFRLVMYFALISLIIVFRATGEKLDFIYFQF